MEIQLNNDKAVIYARYSSDSQTEQSIEGQVRVIKEYARSKNIPIIDSYIDRAISGTSDKRPEFQKLIADSKRKGFGYVLVYKYDRFSRDRLNSLLYKRELKKNGVKVVSVTEYISDDPQGILFESIIDGYSEFYSAELSQKVRRGNRESRIKGLYTGGHVLFGYKVVDKKYIIYEEEAKIVRRIFMDAANGKTYPLIAKELNDEGIYHRGKMFDTQWIFKLLHNKKYIGIVNTNGETFTNIFPPLIDEDTFNKSHVESVSNKRRGAHYKARQEYLLSGKLYCGYCNEPISVDSGTGRNDKLFYYYKCSTRKIKRKECELKSIKKEILEELVVSKIKSTILSSNALPKIADYICKAYNSTISDDNGLKENEKALMKTKKEIDNIVNAIAAGIINESLKDRLSKLEEEKNRLEIESVKIKLKTKNKLTKEDALNFLKSMIDVDNNTKAYKKRIIKRFVKKIVLYNDKMDIYLIAVNELEESNNKSDNNEPLDATTNTKLIIGNGCLILQCKIV